MAFPFPDRNSPLSQLSASLIFSTACPPVRSAKNLAILGAIWVRCPDITDEDIDEYHAKLVSMAASAINWEG